MYNKIKIRRDVPLHVSSVKFGIVLRFLIILCILVSFFVETYSSIKWSEPIVLDKGNGFMGAGTSCTLVLDSNGNPHIAYVDYSNQVAKYVYFDGSSWIYKTLEGDVFYNCSMDLDSFDNPHIIYESVINYAYYDGSDWYYEILGSTIFAVELSIDIDDNDKPHICSMVRGELYYRYKNSNWNYDILVSTKVKNDDCMIKVDNNNYPHIIYFRDYDDNDRKELWYIYWDGIEWKNEQVDADGDFSHENSLTLNQDGDPYISYFDGESADLYFAYFDGIEWYKMIIDSEGSSGLGNSIVLDSNGNPRISYGGTPGKLKYAYYNGIEWIIKYVTDAWYIWYTSLALDKDDNPHIAYYDSDTADLRYIKGERYIKIESISPVSRWNKDNVVDIDIKVSDEDYLVSPIKVYLKKGTKIVNPNFIQIIDDHNLRARFKIYREETGKYNLMLKNGDALKGKLKDCFEITGNNLSWVKVYPNPSKGTEITFSDLITDCKIKIYNINGELVRTMEGEEKIIWDLRNDSGKNISSGIYIYEIIDKDGNKKRGKVCIIK